MSYETKTDPVDGTTIIVTTQAPDALPIGKTLELSTEWQVLIEVPKFEVPELVGSRRLFTHHWQVNFRIRRHFNCE